jgi:hypothetical protein
VALLVEVRAGAHGLRLHQALDEDVLELDEEAELGDRADHPVELLADVRLEEQRREVGVHLALGLHRRALALAGAGRHAVEPSSSLSASSSDSERIPPPSAP